MRCVSNMLTTTGTSLFVMARLTKQRISAMVCTYREGVWTECWRISLCLNGRQRKRKDNPTHAATHAESHRGRLREILQMAMHEKGAQIANRSRAHAGTHAVSHRGAATSENTDDDPRDWRADEPVYIASYLNCFTIIIITS